MKHLKKNGYNQHGKSHITWPRGVRGYTAISSSNSFRARRAARPKELQFFCSPRSLVTYSDWHAEERLRYRGISGNSPKIFQHPHHPPEFGKIFREYLLKLVRLPNLVKPKGFGWPPSTNLPLQDAASYGWSPAQAPQIGGFCSWLTGEKKPSNYSKQAGLIINNYRTCTCAT